LGLVYRWKSFNITHHKIGDNEHRYLRINNNSDLMKFHSAYCDSNIYFVPTDDGEVNVFITDDENLISQILKQDEIIEDIISKVFSSLDRNPTSFEEDLWIPFFSVAVKNANLEDAKSLLKKEYKINFASQSVKIQLNGTALKGNLKVRPDSKSKIIQKPFLYGILHDKVDFPLFAVLVKPEDFLNV